ncbi:MAG: response regulator [bacterium]
MEKKSELNKSLKPVGDEAFVSKQQRILLAEDDDEMRALLAQSLRKAGYEVIEYPDGTSLLDDIIYCFLLDKEEYGQIDLVISDFRMPGGVSGMEILKRMHKKEGFPPMILITAFGDENIHAAAAQFGVAAMFDKPFDINDLVTKVREIIMS